MQIREARIEDATAACEVLRRSIVELCQADHGNDNVFLSKWLANKTPDNVAEWIADENSYTFVAEESGAIVGVGAITDTGNITLNYVSPDARFKGVSKAMLRRLETKARELGLGRCVLESTVTARRFYASAGYVEEARNDSQCQPMTKRL
jgi:N-acetylglutamate synthase-like GNAT family acetyltransferase